MTGSYDATGNSDGTAVAAISTNAVLGRADGTILTLDVSTPSSPVKISPATDLDIGTGVNDLFIAVADWYLFAAMSTSNSAEFTAIDISTPSSPQLTSSINLSGNHLNGLVWDFDLDRVFAAGISNTAEFMVIRPG